MKNTEPKILAFASVAVAIIGALFLMFSCSVSHAAGERVTGANIKAAVMSDNQFSRGFVTGYIAGVFDAQLGLYHCTPATVKEDDIIRLALERLSKNDEPDKLDLLTVGADTFVVRTFMTLYPCGVPAAPASPVNPRSGSTS